MKTGRWATLMLAATLLAGCGDFWQPPGGSGGNGPGGGGCTTNCSNTTSGIFYVLNQETSQLATYFMSSGQLLSITAGQTTLAAKPYAIAIAPKDGFLYVSTSSGIYVFTLDPTTGAPTVGDGGGVISDDSATTMKVDSTGSWLLEAGPDQAEAFAIPIDPTTGLEASGGTKQSVAIPAATVNQLAISPDNANVFIALGTGGTVVIPFASTQTNPFGGTTTKIPAANTGGSALSVAVDPENRVFYVGESLGDSAGNAGGLRLFNYASLKTKLTEATGSPYSSGGAAPHAILPDSSGRYTYVANWATPNTSTGNITGFTLSTSGSVYSLTLGTTVTSGIDPVGLAEENTKAYVLAVNQGGGPDLQVFSFDTTTPGKLDSAQTAATGSDPVQAVAIAAAP